MRHFLKITAVLIVTSLVAVSLCASVEADARNEGTCATQNGMGNIPSHFDVFSDDTMVETYSNLESYNAIGRSKAYTAAAVGTWNGYWEKDAGVWMYGFKMNGVSITNGSAFFSATIDVKKGDYSQDFVFDIPGNSQFVRSNPGTGDMRGVEAVTVMVLDVAVSLIKSTPVGLFWTAASIMEDLGAEFNKDANIDNNDEKKYTWDWNPGHEKVSQYAFFYADVVPENHAELTAEYSVKYRYAPDLFPTGSAGTFNLTMNAPPAPTTMSAQEREAAGIVTVSKDQLMSIGAKLNISEATLMTMMSMDQDVFYFTASAPACEVTEPEPNEFMDISDSLWDSSVEPDPNEPYVTGFSWGDISEHPALESDISTVLSMEAPLDACAEENGIAMISKAQLMSDGLKMGLSDSTIETLVGMGQDVFYFTASSPTCVIVRSDGDIATGHAYETGFSWSEVAKRLQAESGTA